MTDRSREAFHPANMLPPSQTVHQDAVASLLKATQIQATKARLAAVFALIYVSKAPLQLIDEPQLSESMDGIVSRTQENINLGWDFETAFLLYHANGNTKVALRSSHADMIAIRYKIVIEDIDPISGSPLGERASIPLEIDRPDQITAAMEAAETLVSEKETCLH